MSQLVIVESPNKIKKIQSYLGDEYTVSASKGHIRSMNPKELGIDIKHDFTPEYMIMEEKKGVVAGLKKQAKDATCIWLATDYDREGEAISWHLAEVLKIPADKRKRIVFREITKKAISTAIAAPIDLDMNMFYSQQARAVLDKLIGFLISPLLWKQFGNYHLSAGRVQSVAVRMIAERDAELAAFQAQTYYRTIADFITDNKIKLDTVMEPDFKTKVEVETLVKTLPTTVFKIMDIKTSQSKRNPSVPYITSSLQQDASSKLGISPEVTMKRLQTLYEKGYITYHRTDSLMMADDALKSIEDLVKSRFGENYCQRKQYKSKGGSGAQEAHEACRPTDLSVESVEGIENRLYQMIWKRTIASQMKPADVEITSITIQANSSNPTITTESTTSPKKKKSAESTTTPKFITKFEKILFDGFLAIYKKYKSDEELADADDADDAEDDPINKSDGKTMTPALETKIKALSVGDIVPLVKLESNEKLSTPPHPRMTEANLVKELEKAKIGRPSTYASITAKIQERQYVDKRTVEPTEKELEVITFTKSSNESKMCKKKVKVGGEKNKLFITPLGVMVCTFLTKEFEQIMDYKFTADVEGMLDDIAEGKKVWYKVVSEVYEVFNPIIDRLALTIKTAKSSGDKSTTSNIIELGIHPKLGVPIIICKTRYGMAICFNHENKDERLYASITEAPESVTLADAIGKINILGEHPIMGGFIVLNKKKGYYLTHKKKHYALANYNGGDAASIKLEEAIAIIDAGGCGKAEREADPKERVISEDWMIKKGPYGYYLKYKGDRNVKIPKKLLDKLEDLKVEDCLPLLEIKSKAGKTANKAGKTANKAEKPIKVPKEPKEPKESKEKKRAKK